MRVRSSFTVVLGGVVVAGVLNLLSLRFLSKQVRHGFGEKKAPSTSIVDNNNILPPVHINSSWIGNQWIPPRGYRLYSTRELQTYFGNQSILIVGDSTARRTYGTFYGILNATIHPDDVSIHEINHGSVIDVNKGRRKTEYCSVEDLALCRRIANDTNKRFDYLDKRCLSDLVNLTQDPDSFLWRNLSNYSIVIFIMGPWEVMERIECGAGKLGRKNQTDDIFQALFQAQNNNNTTSSSTHFVWRTWGSPGTTHSSPNTGIHSWRKARAHNEYVKRLVDANERKRQQAGVSRSAVSYIDWGQAMLPRLFPQERRIAGDIDAHYGLESRLAFVQMLTNHLVQRDKQERLGIPYHYFTDATTSDQTTNSSNNNATSMQEDGLYNDHLFMTITPPDEVFATFEEKRAFEEAKASFCPNCLWTKGISCQDRKFYLQVKYKEPESKALLGLMNQAPACNKSAVPSS